MPLTLTKELLTQDRTATSPDRLPAAAGPQGEPIDQHLLPDSDAGQFHHECEVVCEGGPDLETLRRKCTKNPGHAGFIPVQEFLKHEKNGLGPNEMNLIRVWADFTVRVVVKFTSSLRPDVYPRTSIPFPSNQLRGRSITRHGTGFVYKASLGIDSAVTRKKSRCPCPECKGSRYPKEPYYKMEVFTSAHVVYNDQEAKATVVEFFYDSEDRTGVRTAYGVEARSSDGWDNCIVSCVTHDAQLVHRLKQYHSTLRRLELSDRLELRFAGRGLMISHPHGQSKHVSVGRFITDCMGEMRIDRYRLPRNSHSSHENVPGEETTRDDDDPDYRYYKLPPTTSLVSHGGHLPDLDHPSGRHMRLPAWTQFKLPGGELVDCPGEAEVDSVHFVGPHVYDMSSCSGSSGAPLLWTGNYDRFNFKYSWRLCHRGAMHGNNISSTVVYFLK